MINIDITEETPTIVPIHLRLIPRLTASNYVRTITCHTMRCIITSFVISNTRYTNYE
jgi:hypothetical protein